MPLSADEIAAAKKAIGEMRSYDAARALPMLLGGILLSLTVIMWGFIAIGGHVEDLRGRDLTGWPAAVSFLQFIALSRMSLFMYLLCLPHAAIYLRLRPKHAENQKLIEEFERKYAAELPYGLESELEKRRALEIKPLLWRVDAFLSRKPVDG